MLTHQQRTTLLRIARDSIAAALDEWRYRTAVVLLLELDRPFTGTYWINVADPRVRALGIVEHTNLVPREHLTNALSLNSIGMQTAKICGPPIAGALIASGGSGPIDQSLWGYLQGRHRGREDPRFLGT